MLLIFDNMVLLRKIMDIIFATVHVILMPFTPTSILVHYLLGENGARMG